MGNFIYYNLQALRLLRGYIQESFATTLNLSTAYYGRIECGEIDIKLSRLVQIIKALDTKPEILFDKGLFVPHTAF